MSRWFLASSGHREVLLSSKLRLSWHEMATHFQTSTVNIIKSLRLEKTSKMTKSNLQANTIMPIKPYHRRQVEAVSPPPWGSLEHIHLQLLHLHREAHGHISFGKSQPSLNIQSETYSNDDIFLAF